MCHSREPIIIGSPSLFDLGGVKTMNTLLSMLIAIGAARLQAAAAFSRSSSFVPPRSTGTTTRFAPTARQYSKTSLSMGLQTAIVGMPNVG